MGDGAQVDAVLGIKPIGKAHRRVESKDDSAVPAGTGSESADSVTAAPGHCRCKPCDVATDHDVVFPVPAGVGTLGLQKKIDLMRSALREKYLYGLWINLQ